VLLATTLGLLFDLVEAVSSLVLVFGREAISVVLELCREATTTSVVRAGFEVLLTSSTGLESERGTELDGGCSLEAMEGTSSATGEELRFPHFDGLSAQAST